MHVKSLVAFLKYRFAENFMKRHNIWLDGDERLYMTKVALCLKFYFSEQRLSYEHKAKKVIISIAIFMFWGTEAKLART